MYYFANVILNRMSKVEVDFGSNADRQHWSGFHRHAPPSPHPTPPHTLTHVASNIFETDWTQSLPPPLSSNLLYFSVLLTPQT